jgi:hypothetical protein
VWRAFGEVDPADPHDTIITDIQLAPRNARGQVEYVATSFIVKPIDMTRSSHLLRHDVPNRGNTAAIPPVGRKLGDSQLGSGGQGDQAGSTAPDNVSGPASQPLLVYRNPVPYRPETLDTREALLTTHASETVDGKIGATATIPLPNGHGRAATLRTHFLECPTRRRREAGR